MSTATVARGEYLVMSDDERAEYEAWREERTPYRDGSAQQCAFVEGMRRAQARAIATVWRSLDAEQREEHLQPDHDLCPVCEPHRSFGTCTSCGADTEALGADELSRCCGSRVVIDHWSAR